MRAARTVFVVLVCSLLIGPSVALSADQSRDRQTADPAPTVEPVTADLAIAQIEPVDFFRFNRRAIFRLWQDYLLRADDEVRHVAVVFGNATIEGRVDGDVVVVFGQARFASTAVVSGAVIVIAGDATIATGAVIRDDLVVVGGVVDAPVGFSPGGEHVVIGTTWMGDGLRAVVPWFTRGLLWGRLIVPDLGWVWSIVGIFLLVSFAINQLLHEPVGACADTLAAKPFSTFLVGLLVLLLVGPLSVLLAVTVVGVVVVPFLWAALLVAWTVGKVGVTRWVGRGVTGQTPPETRLQGMRSFLIGFAGIYLLYLVPVLGLMTWALVGVFGLGAATQTFVAALRRERPPAPPKVGAPQPPPPAPAPPPAVDDTAAAAAFVDVGPAASGSSARAAPADVGIVAPSLGVDPTTAAAAIAGDLTLMLRATFLDRLAAFALDLLLVGIATALLDFRRDGGPFFVLLLAYHIAFWTWKGTTIGGIICNLRVIRTDGQPLRFIDAFIRGLSSLFSFAALGLGVLWILKDPERQAWHDKIAGTYVVTVPRNWPLP